MSNYFGMKRFFLERSLRRICKRTILTGDALLDVYYSSAANKVHLVYLSVERKRHGIGTKVVSEVIRIASVYGLKVILLPYPVEDTTLEELEKFYASLGFTPSTDGYWEN